MASPLHPLSILGQQVDLLAAVFDRTPLGIAIFDRELVLLNCDATWAEFIAGYSRTPASQVSPGARLSVLAPGLEAAMLPLLRRALAGEVVREDGVRVESEGIVSYWDVVLSPLVEEGRVVGVVDVRSDATERAQAAEALRKAHGELATLFSIQQAITSRLDLEVVLQLIADEARRLTYAERATVFLLDGDDLRLAVISGRDEPESMLGYRMPVRESLTGQAMLEGRSVRVGDARRDPRVNHDIIQRAGVHSLVSVPLMSGTQPIGTICVVDRVEGPFGTEDERVLRTLAATATIGLENARLYQEEQRRRQEAEQRRRVAEGLRDILGILNSNRPLAEILEYVVGQASRILGTDTCAIYRLERERGVLTIQAAQGLSADYVASMAVPVGRGGVGRAVQTRRPVAVPDLSDAVPGDYSAFDPSSRAQLDGLMGRYRALLAVPLVVKAEVYGGIVLYYHEPREFSTEEIELASTFGDQAALAIENARLRARAEQLAVAAERGRLARDLHDAVTQTLFSASLIADVLPRIWERSPEEGRRRLSELRELTRGALAEMRTLLLELRPSALTEAALGDLLRQLAEATIGRARLPVALTVESQRPLPGEVQVALYRIAQEALNNVVKHAEASRVVVRLACRDGGAEISVSDDGRGFALGALPLQSLGLGIMRERAATIGAALEIQSQPGAGTEIKVVWSGPHPEPPPAGSTF